ncbi:anhydro-N-acetylmuramic acid kinase [Pseudoduganella flava]|uniref:Anhydro-N-acetylmuramic acid kinase n=1 Tax=Pseudoduganella flava TaxID=871742 RepID=A0A562Q337_9BURK|nr:anhydro-N-acetylmuramic acid kinase [Pseudoduganella flava]QGZ41170.1 anhydro-N-acetylmuramic acid kinase [Pseudoduganella flava]TWI51102.1 anhydro-N-acetylmuramic acid kinase [Pseudoduganella flava]
MSLFIGLMSGTSLDGVDGVLVDFWAGAARTMASHHVPYPPALLDELRALQAASDNELEREALAGNGIAEVYAQCVAALLEQSGMQAADVRAIGAHGQTIRHRPELGFTRQTINGALLAELTGIDAIVDFRSRDVAAGGQGAPLVPAAHLALFGEHGKTRVLANIGGIANISVLQANGHVTGFDTGPGNVLIDEWTRAHLGKPYDDGGAWAASGRLLPDLLAALLAEPYFALPPPKSTGRDLFHADWLRARLAGFGSAAPADVAATLTRLTAQTLAAGIHTHAAGADALYVCGGGAYNDTLLRMLAEELGAGVKVQTTQALGADPSHVEALCWAWLAWRFDDRKSGNLPSVTGARGERVLGALYPR